MSRWPRLFSASGTDPDGQGALLGRAMMTGGTSAPPLGGNVTSARPGSPSPVSVPAADHPPRTSAEVPAAQRRGPRRARLALRHVDPFSVLKVAFLFSLAMLVVVIVAVALLYLVLDTMGVFTSIDKALRDLTTSTAPTSVTDIISFQRVLGAAAVLGAVNVLLFTGLATLGAFLYNLCASIGGGIEVTLSERN